MLDEIDVPGVPTLPTDGPAAAIEGLPTVAEEPDTPEPATGPTPEPSPAGQPAAPRARRRRRTKAQMEAERAASSEAATAAATAEAAQNKAHLAKALGLGFDAVGRILAASRGAHWQLREEETTQLGGAWAEALAPYMGAIGQHTPLIAAVLVTVGVAAPRVLEERRRLAPPVIPVTGIVADVQPAPAPSIPPAEATTAATPPAATPSADGTIPIEPPRRRGGSARA